MKKKQYYLIALQIFLSAGLASYAYIGSFTRMLADDFCSAYQANNLGLLRSIWFWYRIWAGKFSAFAADWFVLTFTLGPYKLHYFLPIMIVLWLVFLISIFYLYLRSKGSLALLYSIVLSTIFLFTFFLISPNIEQSVFWWNGARSYSFPMFLLTMSVFLLYAVKQFPAISSKVSYGLIFILSFIVGGTGETYVIGQAGLLSFLIFLNIREGKNKSRTDLFILIAGLAGTLLAIVVIVLSPGNAVRQKLLPPPPGLVKLTLISIQSYAMFIYDFFTNPIKVIGLVAAILVCIWIGMQYKDSISSTPRQIFFSIFGAVAISFLCFPPGVYGYSEPPPSRTLMVPAFFFLFYILQASYLLGIYAAGLPGKFRLNENLIMTVTFILVGSAIFFNSMDLLNQRQAYADFAQKWDEVDKMILDAKANNQKSVKIPAMNNWAYVDAPANNPKYWLNRCYNTYYGIEVDGPPIREIMENYYKQGFH